MVQQLLLVLDTLVGEELLESVMGVAESDR